MQHWSLHVANAVASPSLKRDSPLPPDPPPRPPLPVPGRGSHLDPPAPPPAPQATEAVIELPPALGDGGGSSLHLLGREHLATTAVAAAREEALDGAAGLAQQPHAVMRLQEDDEYEEGHAHAHHDDGEAPVGGGDGELCDAKDGLSLWR